MIGDFVLLNEHNMHVYVCVYTCMYVCVRMCKCVYMCVCVCEMIVKEEEDVNFQRKWRGHGRSWSGEKMRRNWCTCIEFKQLA